MLFAWPISIVGLLVMDINDCNLVELTITTGSSLDIVITLGLSGRVIGIGLLAVGVVLAVATALLLAVVLILAKP